MKKLENKNNLLDGSWKNNCFTVKIKGNNYISYYNGIRYGKGYITYENGEFTLTSTHAREFILWIPFEEIVSGKYNFSNDSILISDIEGRYEDFNGLWKK